MQLFLGTMQSQLKHLEDNSVDSIVTDPPYGIDFMGKKWDYDVPTVEMWEECIRVLKPGGHLLSFSSARTYHRMTVAIEDAGFEIRDQIMWVYGSGFPKSHNIGKNYDKRMGRDRVDAGPNPNNRPNPNNKETATHDYGFVSKSANITVGDGPFEGWGTALKPSHEPIVVARKPLSEKTVVDNCIKWGVGGLNINASRVPNDGETFDHVAVNKTELSYGAASAAAGKGGFIGVTNLKPGGNVEAIQNLKDMGRWPANFIHDGSQQVLDLFPDSQGGHWPDSKTTGGGESWGGKSEYHGTGPKDKGKGSAARFFYVPKVSKKDRNEGLDGTLPSFADCGKSQPTNVRDRLRDITEGRVKAEGLANTHPTVKPTDLMHYLIRMVTPAGGVVLDPFMGSGSTGKAAVRHGYDFIGIEMEEESFGVAKARIEWEMSDDN